MDVKKKRSEKSDKQTKYTIWQNKTDEINIYNTIVKCSDVGCRKEEMIW